MVVEVFERDRLAWGRALPAGATLFHQPTMVVGKLKKFWDGDAEKYRSTIDGSEVDAPVIELESGHSLLAYPTAFVVLDGPSARFFEAIQAGLSGLVVVSAKNAAASGVEQEAGIALTIAALRMQLAALEAVADRAPENEVPG